MALIFLNNNDFKGRIDANIQLQITDGDDTIIDTAESLAMSIIQDRLSASYDLDAEFAKTDNERHKNLIRWMLNLTIYFLYEGVPDMQVPERVVKNYDDTMKELKEIEAGKFNTTLTKLIDESTGKNETIFRWGSNKKRSHQP